ncbi:MAG: HAD-IIB family hydrolase [Planctomycetota bacterium]
MNIPHRTSRPPWLLISDVDHTVLGGDDTTARFADFVEANRDRLAVCYSSGRFCDSILDSVATSALPTPDIVTGGVGTEMRPVRDSPLSTAVDLAAEAWAKRLDLRWDPDTAHGIAASIDGLARQPEEFQSRYKQSYHWFDATPEQLDRLRSALDEAGLNAKVVYSSNRDLDLLPAAADKGAAARHLADHLGYSTDRVIVAGDSGNDAAFFAHGFRGVVVQNALPELKAAAPDAYHAKAHEGDGVVEGIEHHWAN